MTEVKASPTRVVDTTVVALRSSDSHIGTGVDGVGIGIETQRSYLSEDVPSGSKQTVIRHLRALLGRDDVIRIWFKPIGSKHIIWEHLGPLTQLPNIDHLFEVAQTSQEAAA